MHPIPFFSLTLLTIPLLAMTADEPRSPTEEEQKAAWIGTWQPSTDQDLEITKDFELRFSDEFPLPYLKGKQFELHLQSDEGEVGAEAVVEKRHLIFMLYASDEDPTNAWLVIHRVEKRDGKRTLKVLIKTYFRRTAL